jgi:hypothetical protein
MSSWIGARRRGLATLGLLAAVGCGRPAAPSPPSAAPGVDVLDYIVGDPSLWPRRGTNSQNQIVDLAIRDVCWVKYANPRTFECWRWDDQFVYHEVDHAVDGNTGESYRFTDGRWLPRHLAGAWSLDVSNRIVWFDRGCQLEAARSGPFRYRQRAWLDPALDAGGELSGRDVLVLEYWPEDPAGGPTEPEHFYFAKGAGWYEWDRGTAHVTFDRLGGPATPLARETICSQ